MSLRNAIRTFEDLENGSPGGRRASIRGSGTSSPGIPCGDTYYLGLIEKMNDGIWRQAIPDVEELEHYMDLMADPLDEEGDIPLGGPRTIIHRYPDRVLFYVSNECAMYCRFLRESEK